jgi:dTDP-glucose 4,6-dehydratase
MNILVTGGCGFIGSHFIEDIINNVDVKSIINVDSMTYAANPHQTFNNHEKYRKYELDINSPKIGSILDFHGITHIVHFAAESHVDNSIKSPDIFIKTNINGTFNLLDAALKYKNIKKFIHVSTDEVFGSLSFNDPPFTLTSPYRPNSPYAASKAASDLLVRSYFKTYGLPTIITNCSNNFGPRQFPEKLIPLAIGKLKNKQLIPVYGDGRNIRDWIYVKDHATMLTSILLKGAIGQQYLLGGMMEISNLQLISMIATRYEKLMQEKIPDFCLQNPYFEFVEDRKGHDLRYAINCFNYLKEFPNFNFTNFNAALDTTIKSYI